MSVCLFNRTEPVSYDVKAGRPLSLVSYQVVMFIALFTLSVILTIRGILAAYS